jgi:hypothetical protein
MSTLAQITANQQNSEKSTGPKTPEGKKRSALNAIRHNLTGQVVVVQESEAQIYDAHCREYRADLAPKGKVEVDLTQELADLRWSINRIRAHETNLFSFQSVALSSKLESGDPDVNSAMEISASLEKNMKTLALLSVYEQRKLRAFEKTLAKLKEIQSERKAQESIDLRKAAEFREVFQNEEPDWTPAHDGFVCSEAQVEAYIRQSERAQIVYCARNGQLDPRDRTQKRS